jgi:Leucine-rich repeat (LRR) protein
MKNIFLLLLLFAGIVNAQIINIPDANFKAKLIDLGFDPNSDGEIQVSEVQFYSGSLVISNSNISDITGIEYFVSLTHLDCSNNNISSIDRTHSPDRGGLECDGTPLANLNIAGLANLGFLGITDSLLTSVDLTTNAVVTLRAHNCQQLTSINAAGGHISYFDVSETTHVQYLNLNSCSLLQTGFLNDFLQQSNELTYVDLTGLADFSSFSINAPNLNFVSMAGCTGLTALFLTGQFSAIDI